VLEPISALPPRSTEPKVRGSNPLGRVSKSAWQGDFRSSPNADGWQQGNTDGVALQPTEVPGVYRGGSRFVVVYRAEGRQRKQSADTLVEVGVIKLKRDGEARAKRRGPTLHEFSLSWLNRYARQRARQYAPRIPPAAGQLALSYFNREVRVGEMDRSGAQQFVDWLTTRPGGVRDASSGAVHADTCWASTRRGAWR